MLWEKEIEEAKGVKYGEEVTGNIEARRKKINQLHYLQSSSVTFVCSLHRGSWCVKLQMYGKDKIILDIFNDTFFGESF